MFLLFQLLVNPGGLLSASFLEKLVSIDIIHFIYLFHLSLLLSSLTNESWFLCFLWDIISLVKEIVSLLGFSEDLFLLNMVDNAVIILVPSFLIMVHISNVMARVSIQCPTSMNHKSLKLIWFVINQNMERSLNIFSVFFKVRSLFNESHQLE